ncbi:EF hand domain containing protein [Trypanosoma grayi]|uniref:EF hand domain containing protein n=1 Tax=Trypanosoma grayi TaxID=71804 RepID=UPI0004F400D9|nr:EF hand domain containing protein [Trypanosoma grayi]KEG09310.1 EF hand domain containing protein [Trypanosoma grayi]
MSSTACEVGQMPGAAPWCWLSLSHEAKRGSRNARDDGFSEETHRGWNGDGEDALRVRPPRPALPREAVHPFLYNRDASQSPLQTLKLIVLSLLLLPLRLVYVALLLTVAAGLSLFAEARGTTRRRCGEAANGSSNSGRQIIRRSARSARRWATLAFGYWRIGRVKRVNYGRHTNGTYAEAPIVVANHCTLQDGLLLCAEHDASLAAGDVDAAFLRHREASHTASESDSSGSPADGNKPPQQPQQQTHCSGRGNGWRPSVVFPEACCTNGRALIQFDTDAFAPGAPVQPICVRHPYTHFDPSWCGANSPWAMLLQTMCQLYNAVELTYLPVYAPTLAEQQDSALYAENVRRAMAHAMLLPVTAHNSTDVRLMLMAHHLQLPFEAVNVEAGHSHFSAVPYKRMERMLQRFIAALNPRSKASCEQATSQRSEHQQHVEGEIRQRYRHVPEGFMTPLGLGEFLAPFGAYPILLERLLQHLSRHASVRGVHVAFRDFLSAMGTEPIALQQSVGSPLAARALYIDEIKEEDEALTAALRRTFAMILLVGEALLAQREERQGGGGGGGAHESSVHVAGGTSSTCCTSIYGHEIRYLFQASQDGVMHAAVATVAAVSRSVGDRRLSRGAFDALLDILLVPHHSTMWRGGVAKSSAQLAEEDALFAYICGGVIASSSSSSAAAAAAAAGCATDGTASHVTFPAFLRFARRHRAVAEYFHACCEHYLLGDDLA